MATDKAISTLNELIETCRNGEEGFREAAEHVKDGELAGLFAQYADQRARFAGELESEVLRLGAEPETSGTLPGAAHRAWIELRSAVQGGDRKAILAEVERGEDVAKDKYESAIREALPGDAKQIIDRQYTDVRAAHDQIRSMRDAAR
jgi:uncharacterized protein (TIGR02284 family)